MSGVKFELQKEVFEETKERLHSVVGVNKLGSKKKPQAFLCITGSIERPIRFTIYLIKKSEKGFKRKQYWMLSTLRESNYKSKQSLEFDLQLDNKLYQWEAETRDEKDNFFSLLYQICSRLHRSSPKFLNYEPEEEDGGGASSIAAISVPKDGQIEESDEEEFGLTDREETDLEKVFARQQNAVVNAEAYMEQLARELSMLDGENIHSIMESEGQINALMDSIDISVNALDEIDKELSSYDEAVKYVRKSVEKIEEENLQMGVAAKNNQLLLAELGNLIDVLDFPQASYLSDPDLKADDGIKKATHAALLLKETLNLDDRIHPALLKMTAVIEQRKLLERIREKFSKTLTLHLDDLFSKHGVSESRASSLQALRLCPLNKLHNELLRYRELSGWLKVSNSDLFAKLLHSYTSGSSGVQRVYEENVKELFKEAAKRISGANASSRLSSSMNDLRIRGRYFGKTRSLANRDGDNESQGSGEGSVDSLERQHFYDVFEQLLEGLGPAVNAEEHFISNFFHIEAPGASTPSSAAVSPSRGSGGELRRIMVTLFGSIEAELNSFLLSYEKMEPSFCMGAMVRLGHHALKPDNTSCYIGVIFGTVLIQEKRSFDRLMNTYVQAIGETRAHRKAKVGILAFVAEFEDFALMAESIFDTSARRSELEKWYVKMLSAIFDGIARHSSDGGKTPGEVVRMENFHRLHAILSKLKVAAMDALKKEAKNKYNEALNAYVTKYLGRPLVKLNEFFEGVQQKVSQGVKESEIGYQMAFSRAELKRVIKEYPSKEVKKGLESLYRKVEKHLSEEENLLQVVWRAMQEEFIVQYKSLESLIGRCYPGAKITLEFTIEEILLFFSEIAQSH